MYIGKVSCLLFISYATQDLYLQYMNIKANYAKS
jgi:hypothetical protein